MIGGKAHAMPKKWGKGSSSIEAITIYARPQAKNKEKVVKNEVYPLNGGGGRHAYGVPESQIAKRLIELEKKNDPHDWTKPKKNNCYAS